MVKAYTLRPAYEGNLIGGSVSVGPEVRTLNILEALEAGGGEIVTSDNLEQAALENYYGAEGPVFDVAIVEDGERRPVALTVPQPVPTGTEPQGPQTGGPIDSVPDAQHSEGSDYQHFSVEELRQVVNDRGIESVGSRATKTELITALEADDQQGETSEDE